MREIVNLETVFETPRPLSKEQEQAVVSESRYVRIIAGAGAGKTETLTRRIAHLLLCRGEEPGSIVAFTFTERAAQSMKSRIYERVQQLHGEEACARLGKMYVGTIHGYCLQLLQDRFGYGDHDPLDENQQMAFLLREGWGLGLGKNGAYSRNCAQFLRSVDVVYNELLDRDKLGRKAPDFLGHLEKYEELLKKHRLITFGQMINLAVQKLYTSPDVSQDTRHLIVDEYQDVNRAQDRLIKLIGRDASIFVVGDPRQSIYQWRGSDERYFEEFAGDFPTCERLSLKENWRSVPSIIKVANSFAETFKRARYESLNATRKEKGLVTVLSCENPESEADWIAEQIRQLVTKKEPCRYSDFAVLLRSVSTSAEPFLQAFRSYGIPFLVGGKVGLFRRDEAQTVGRLFAWLSNRGFWVEGTYGQSDREAGDDLLRTGIERWRGTRAPDSIPAGLAEKLRAWKQEVVNCKYKDLTSAFQALLILLGFLDLNPENRLHAAVMANLGRFSTLLMDYEASIRLGGRRNRWASILNGLCWYMTTYAANAYEEQAAEDFEGVDAVQIMTVHQAKGLEWPVVFLPCLTTRRFPTARAGRPQKWFIPRELEGFDAERYEGGIEDERRLFYVAVTRARDLLCLSHFRRISKRQRTSEFLEVVQQCARAIAEGKNLPQSEIKRKSDGEEIQAFSPSEIITYLKCPYLYRLRQVWGYKPKLDDALGYGKALHHCLRCTSEFVKRGEELEKAVHRSVEEKFHLPYARPKPLQKLKASAIKVLTEFAKQHREDMQRIEEVEARLEFPIEKATIAGRVDVILRGDGNQSSLEVRDYKTSDVATTWEESSLQLQLYTLGLNRANRPVERASVAYLDSEHAGPHVEPVPVGPPELEAAERIAVRCIEGIRAACFTGKPNSHCEVCDFERVCKWGDEAP